ncbi:9865_t:CDS:2, partial [Dentiscutata heterogama]
YRSLMGLIFFAVSSWVQFHLQPLRQGLLSLLMFGAQCFPEFLTDSPTGSLVGLEPPFCYSLHRVGTYSLLRYRPHLPNHRYRRYMANFAAIITRNPLLGSQRFSELPSLFHLFSPQDSL